MTGYPLPASFKRARPPAHTAHTTCPPDEMVRSAIRSGSACMDAASALFRFQSLCPFVDRPHHRSKLRSLEPGARHQHLSTGRW